MASSHLLREGSNRFIYLDYNATTPVENSVLETMLPYFREKFGNPSSSHRLGSMAKEAVEEAREKLASFIGSDKEEIIFTSGGTEANNLVLFGVIRALGKEKVHVITSKIEHPSVLNPAIELMNRGVEVTFVSVDRYGMVDPDDIRKAIKPHTVLVSIMHSNNEIGTIEPIEEIGRIVRGKGVLFHSDASQSLGKVPINVVELGVDFLTIAGHKFYAPKGIGALYCRKGAPIERILFGAGQERGLRPGTENVPYIVGLGKAAEISMEALQKGESQRLLRLRNLLRDKILERCEKVIVNGHPEKHLPNTLSISFYKKFSFEIIKSLKNVLVSSGAACHSNSVKVSHVIEAIGVDPDYKAGTIRFSLGRFTTEDEVLQASEEIVKVVVG